MVSHAVVDAGGPCGPTRGVQTLPAKASEEDDNHGNEFDHEQRHGQQRIAYFDLSTGEQPGEEKENPSVGDCISQRLR
jgi:hypothetical protein